MPHSFSVGLEPEDGCWIRAPAAVMVVHESNFHAPCCEACGKEWGKTVPTAESDPFVTVLTELHVQPPILDYRRRADHEGKIVRDMKRVFDTRTGFRATSPDRVLDNCYCYYIQYVQ